MKNSLARLSLIVSSAVWVGCAAPPGPSPEPSTVSPGPSIGPTTAPASDRLIVNVGETYSLQTILGGSAYGWPIGPLSDRAVIEPNGTLRVLKPGTIQFSYATSPGPSWNVWLAGVASPSPGRQVGPSPGNQWKAKGGFQTVMFLNSQEALDFVWANKLELAGDKPLVDFRSRSLMVHRRFGSVLEVRPGVVTHIEPASPPVVHLTVPVAFRDLTPVPGVVLSWIELIELDKVPGDSVLAMEKARYTGEDPFWTPTPTPSVPPKPGLWLDTGVACVGTKVDLRVTGIRPGAEAAFYLTEEPRGDEPWVAPGPGAIALGTAVGDEDGDFVFSFTVEQKHLAVGTVVDGVFEGGAELVVITTGESGESQRDVSPFNVCP